MALDWVAEEDEALDWVAEEVEATVEVLLFFSADEEEAELLSRAEVAEEDDVP